MPVLVRVARIAQVPDGAEHKVRTRGLRLVLRNVGGRFDARDAEGRAYRAEARGDHVYVALDPDANAAPAEIQLHGARPPTPIA